MRKPTLYRCPRCGYEHTAMSTKAEVTHRCPATKRAEKLKQVAA